MNEPDTEKDSRRTRGYEEVPDGPKIKEKVSGRTIGNEEVPNGPYMMVKFQTDQMYGKIPDGADV